MAKHNRASNLGGFLHPKKAGPKKTAKSATAKKIAPVAGPQVRVVGKPGAA